MTLDPFQLSAWVYRRLLKTYPAGFRARFSAEMMQVFSAICEENFTLAGWRGLALLWMHMLPDWLGSLLAQWWASPTWRKKGGIMQTDSKEVTFGLVPLTIPQTLLALLPFLLFGLASLADRLVLRSAADALPLWQAVLINPYLLFNGLVLLGLAAGIIAGFPRWALSYFAWAVLFAWWWTPMRFSGLELGGKIWLPLLTVITVALLIRRSLLPARAIAANLWRDLTLFPFALYVLYAWVFLLADENHNPYLLVFIAANTLALSAGAWGFFRVSNPLMRVLALIAGLLAAALLEAINNATWDYRAYYGLPSAEEGINVAGMGLLVIIPALMIVFGLLARWRLRGAAL